MAMSFAKENVVAFEKQFLVKLLDLDRKGMLDQRTPRDIHLEFPIMSWVSLNLPRQRQI